MQEPSAEAPLVTITLVQASAAGRHSASRSKQAVNAVNLLILVKLLQVLLHEDKKIGYLCQMNRKLLILIAAALFFVAAPRSFAQEQQEPDIDQVIQNQLDNLTKMFKLDDVQVFFVDSILTYNYHAMMDEMQEARKIGASNSETFQGISDKWMDATDKAFEKLFTEEQWAKYMKSSYGKEKKRRDKRIEERGGIQPTLTGPGSGADRKRP